MFWMTVVDRGEKQETTAYFIWPMIIIWSGVGLAWSAAWNVSFNGSLLVDARTGCKQGTLLEALLWVIFLLEIVGALALMHLAYTIHVAAWQGATTKWKAKYMAMVTPKDKIIQEIILPDGRRIDGATQRIQSDALRWNV